MPSEGDSVTRRYILQTLGTIGAAGLAGCSGGNNSNGSGESDEKNSSDVDTTPEETTEPEPDYSLPESEHANPVDMATEWMLYPDDGGTDLEAVALSPSKLEENYDKSFTRDIGAHEKYSPFEFHHTDIPETYVQKTVEPWDSLFKVDQLPKNVTKAGLGHQLKDAGYEFREEKGDFDVYEGEDGFHAIGDDRHIVVLQSSTVSTSKQRDLMSRILEQKNEDDYQPSETMQRGFDELDVKDSLTIIKTPGYAMMPSTGTSSHQPDIGISSVDFEDGQKYGAWPFEDSESAESALALLQAADDLRDGYEAGDVKLSNRTVTASEANYGINQMNTHSWLRISEPRI